MSGIKLQKELLERLERAKAVLTGARSAKVRVISHYDADGISSAAVLSIMLRRLGVPFHATMTQSLDSRLLDSLKNENGKCFIFSDMGSGQLELLEKLQCDTIVLDHHKPLRDSERVIHVNPSLFGSNGTTDVSGATTCFLLAQHIDDANWDAAVPALAGAHGDMQHLGGYRGLNLDILNEAIKRRIIVERKSLQLQGNTLADSILNSPEPYFKGLTGKPEILPDYVNALGIKPDINYSSYSEEDLRRVASALMMTLASNGCDYENVSQILSTQYYSELTGVSIAEMASLANACGRTGNYGLGLAMELADGEATAETLKFRLDYNKAMISRLNELEEGIEEMDNIQYFRSDDPSLAGALCGLYMAFIGRKDRPTFSYSLAGETYKVSGRGTKALVASGLDLAESLSVSASKFGGHGGGHVIASGATVPKEHLMEFLKSVDEITGKQIRSTN
ncbi:MAG: DHH family phosphoesterase [Thermoplasmata archaeon]|nr:DHH family phosphoesterase [Candidatus Sysuiplasma acidicola]MDH2905881.1 DHH family phosphoesterase [Methanomassiliicoccales archaeon]